MRRKYPHKRTKILKRIIRGKTHSAFNPSDVSFQEIDGINRMFVEGEIVQKGDAVKILCLKDKIPENLSLAGVAIMYGGFTNLAPVNLDLREATFDESYMMKVDLSQVHYDRVTSTSERELMQMVYDQVTKHPASFNLRRWHGRSGTVHSWSGWVCVLDPELRKAKAWMGTNMAANLALPTMAKDGRFFSSVNNDQQLIAWAKDYLDGKIEPVVPPCMQLASNDRSKKIKATSNR